MIKIDYFCKNLKKRLTMWNYAVRFILRNRIAILIGIGLITCFMGYKAMQVKLSYEMARMLPTTDKHFVKYEQFRKVFGEDGNVIFIGFVDSTLYEKENFLAMYDLCEEIRAVDGVEAILSVTNIFSLEKNDTLKQFGLLPVVKRRPESQAEVDSIRDKVQSLRFYDGLLFNKETNSYIIGVTLDKKKLNDKSRVVLVNAIRELLDSHEKRWHTRMHYSGLPYIRTVITQMIQDELYLFITISLIISALIIILFFRSFYVILTSFAIVAVSVVWAMGIVTLFGYKISILIGVMPSLLIIIGIENCIFLVNKYHLEYKSHGNKIKSLSKVVSRIGFATFMTNATTAAGFATFIFTSNQMMKEFGVVSSLNIMIEYVLSLVLTVIIFSLLPEPERKHLKHLDRKTTNFVIDFIKKLITRHRMIIYVLSVVLILVCGYGVTLMHVSGKLVDDIPVDNPIYQDLKFFEANAGGVMPFEIVVDTREPKGIFKDGAKVIYKIKQLQKEIQNDSSIAMYFSKPLSIVEAVCFANQAYHDGRPKYYIVPPPMELNKLSQYVNNTPTNKNSFRSFIDSNMQVTRVSIQVADVGSKEMNRILDSVTPMIERIFPAEEYTVGVTGSSVVFSKGTEFLIGNLWQSIIIGIVFISILIAIVFSSVRMIMIAMVVNLIPLLITAAIMGYFDIPVKPSTIIVFSVALGISIDNAILFLSRYRYELKRKKKTITESVICAIDDSAISMMYASIVLVLGFAIYMLSGFGGTKALGFLISVTLLVALFFNILVLPSLLLSLDKMVVTPAFEDSFMEIEETEDDEEDRGDLLLDEEETKESREKLKKDETKIYEE